MEKYIEKAQALLVEFVPKVLIALAILIIGLLSIKFIVKTSKKLMVKEV